jgi:acyl dehydratase
VTLMLEAFGVARGSAEEGMAWIGRDDGPRECERVIDEAQAQLFCALVRDANPAYWARPPAGVMPPGLLLSLTVPLPWRPDGADRRPLWARVPLPGDRLINVSTTTEHQAPIALGARLQVREEVVAVSPEKRTRVGDGQFLTTRSDYLHEDRVVATHENVLLRYRGDAVTTVPAGVEAAGEGLAVTLEQCVLNVAATHDLYPGHYDPDHARAQGVAGPFLNTMFFHGLVDRVALERLGTGWRIARRELRMLAPACVGDAVRATARQVGPGRVEVLVSAGARPCAQAVVTGGEAA